MTESTRDPATVPIPPLSAYVNASFDELTPVLEQIAVGATDRARVDAASGLVLHRALRLLRVESRETLLKEGLALDGFLYSAAGSAFKTAQPDLYWGWIGISGLLGEAARRSDRAAVDSILASHAGRGRALLELLAERGAPMRRGEIRERLKLSESHLSHLLRDLAEADLIERAKEGREVAVALGPVGRDVVKCSVLPAWVRYLAEVLTRLRSTGEPPEGLAEALAERGAAPLVARQLAAALAGNDWTPEAGANARRLIEAQTGSQTQEASGAKVSRFSSMTKLLDGALFPALSPEDLSVLARCGEIKTFPRNTVLFLEGQPSGELYIVVTGQVKVFASEAQGKEVIFSIEGPGGYFGELGLVDEVPRSASVMTTEPSLLMMVSKSDFQGCLSSRPDLGTKLMRLLVRLLVPRVRTLTERVKSFAFLDVYGRVAQTLQSLAIEQRGQHVIEQRVTHKDIASMVGASPGSVSRIMRDLVVGGYIEMKDKHIRIKEKLPAGW